MLVPSLDYYWPDVARGAEEAARELDMRVVLRGSSYETEDDRPQLTRLVERMGVDGAHHRAAHGRADRRADHRVAGRDRASRSSCSNAPPRPARTTPCSSRS